MRLGRSVDFRAIAERQSCGVRIYAAGNRSTNYLGNPADCRTASLALRLGDQGLLVIGNVVLAITDGKDLGPVAGVVASGDKA
jgi:hypothetical protein